MRTLLIDGGTLTGEEALLTDKYLKRLKGPWKTTVKACRKDVPAALLSSKNIVLLDINGQQRNSEEFARWAAKLPTDAVFVIGGSHGIRQEWRHKESISLGKITMPHRLACAVLAEQLYRAYTLMIGHPYHH